MSEPDQDPQPQPEPENEPTAISATEEYEAELQKRMKDYRDMWNSEHNPSYSPVGVSDKQIKTTDKAIDDVIELRKTSKETLINVMKFSDSDSTRARVAMFIYREILDWDAKNNDGNEMDELMKSIVKKAPTS